MNLGSKPMAEIKKPYFFWVMPSGVTYTRLQKIIDSLSRQYSTFNFKPHVSLLGHLLKQEEEVVSRMAQLANLLQPYEIELTNLGFSNAFFRCLYFNVKRTKRVVEANLKAKKVFNTHFNREYIPHLSLMYGNLPVKEKKKLVKNLKHNLDVKKFIVREIHLFSSASKDIKKVDWYKVRTFSLKNSS
jgi:2'-5' RNA ligase